MARLLLILGLLLGSVLPASSLTITFKPEGTADDSTIRLGDIVSFDEQSEMTRALATLPIGQSPAPGEKRNLRAMDIRQYVVSSQSLTTDIKWNGAEDITLLRTGIDIGPERIEQIITDFIAKSRDSLPDAEIRFLPDSLPLPFTLPAGNLTYEVLPSNPNILGSTRFAIIFRVDNEVVKNMSVRGKIEALAQIVVARESLRRGSIVHPQQLSTALVDINQMDSPGFALEDFVGKKLKRSVRPGAPLLHSMVEALPIVRRGEQVKIVINRGSLHLSATGLAISDGVLDEMIQVRNTSSNKMIYCRVAAPGMVEVML